MTTAPRPLGHGLGGEPSAAAEAPRAAPSARAPADRRHNREDPSASEMAEMLREVQDALAAADERLDGLEGAQGNSSVVTRRLAVNVAEMGEALARRMRSLEGRETMAEPTEDVSRPTLPRRPENRLALSLGMAVALALALAGFWMFGRREAPRPPPAAPAPRAAAPVAAIVPATPAPLSVPKAAARRPSPPPRRRLAAPRAAPAVATEAGPPVAGYRSFGPAAPPAVAPATANPPKPPA